MLFFAGRASEKAILRRAQERLPAEAGARAARGRAAGRQLQLGDGSARGRATIACLARSGGPARDVLQATTLATLAMEEVLNLRSASTAIDLAERALAVGLPLEPHRGELGELGLAALAAADGLDAALRATDEILARARERGAALTVVAISSLRARIALRRGDLAAAEADAQAAIELAPDLLGAEFVVLAVAAAVLAGLERDETPDSLRRLIDGTGVRADTEFLPSSPLRYASACFAPRPATTKPRSTSCAAARRPPMFGGENPAMLPWRSAAALSLARPPRRSTHPGRRRGAPRTVVRRRHIGIALRAQALVGPPAERSNRLAEAVAVLEPSPARLEHARVLVDLGATFRAAGQRSAAREPLLEGLGWRPLRRPNPGAPGAGRARGDRHPTPTGRSAGGDSLTPSERRVVELAAAGGTNRDRADAVRHREDGGDPPRTVLPQARHLVSAAASGRARARAAG